MDELNGATKPAAREMVISRTFNAPRNLVWQAWTEPDRVKKWWGPRIFTAPVVKIDFRVGREYLYCMRSPEGKDYWSKGTYREIVAPERIVLTDSFADEKGNIVSGSYYGLSPDFALESLVTLVFEEYDGKTRFTLRYLGIPDGDFDNAQAGWNESFDKLAEYLADEGDTKITAEPGKQELFITREFDAPPELVYKAFTDPELYVQWVCPRRFKMTLDKFEPVSGGRWRYVHEDKGGLKFGFHGVFHEVSPSLLIDTFEFEGLPEKGHVSLETARLEKLPGGRTMLSIQSVFQSVADRDGMIQGGMEAGVRESHERLAELLEKMKKEEGSQMVKLSPYLRFNGNCREAMGFYKECLGGELTIMTMGESPMASQMPPEMKNRVMHSMLKKDNMTFMASDAMGPEKIMKGNTISLSIMGIDMEEIRPYFSKLSSGGVIKHPLKKTFFGVYGDFTDKFGIDWMFQADNPK
jgi:uncharacterized protein YndB with AHSA1/START domain/uncharacterized glyoxalase superfamily protein PhnB